LAAAWQWQNAVASLKVAEVERANALEQEDIANKALGDAERNATGGLAALSTIAKDDDPIKSAKLALAAWPRTASSESVQLEEVITNLSDAAPKLLERDWLRRRSTEIAGAAFSGDGAFFAIHKRGGEIVLREVESGQEILSHEGYTEIAGFAFSPDGRYFAASSSDDAALLWELSSQAGPVRLPAGGGQIATVAFSPTGLLLVGSVFGEVTVWDPSDATGPKSRFNIETPPDDNSPSLWHLNVSPNGRLFVSGTRGGVVRFWDITSGEAAGELSERVDSSHFARLGYSPDGAIVFAVEQGGDYRLRLWDAETHEERLAKADLLMGGVNAFAFAPGGSKIALGQPDGSISLLRLNPQTDAESSLKKIPTGHTGRVTSIAFSLDGERLLSGGEDGTARLWRRGCCRQNRSRGPCE
jgi:WD40 repeat protein